TVAEGVEISAYHCGADAWLQRRRKHRDSAASGDPHAAYTFGVKLVAALDPIDRAHHIMHTPADHGLPEQKRCAGHRLASRRVQLLRFGARIAAAPESDRLDGDSGHTVFRYLNGEIVLIARLVGAIAAFGIDSHDIVHAAAMAGHTNHRGVGRF